MINLLAAEFSRLFKSLIFKLYVIFSALSGVFFMLYRFLDIKIHAVQYTTFAQNYKDVTEFLFIGCMFLPFAMAALVGRFVGAEYIDGTLRNKSIAGHNRLNVFLSKFIVCASANVGMLLLNFLLSFVSGKLLLEIHITAKAYFTVVLLAVMATLFLTAMLLFILLAIPNKITGAVGCVLLVIMLLFVATTVSQRLAAPEFYTHHYVFDSETGIMQPSVTQPNPDYLRGLRRQLYELVENISPMSQFFQCCMGTVKNLLLSCISALVGTLAFLGGGYWILKKSNIK